MNQNKIYFISDLHLGASALKNNFEREKYIVSWLDSIKNNCSKLFLLGDTFDFWFEYRYAVPKGYIRFLGKLCEMSDLGIEIHLFTGNHDIWIFDYLPKECGIILHTQNESMILNGKKFYIGHGDGLDPNDKGFRVIRKIFHCKFLQRCFRWIHPDLGISFARKWSSHSRLSHSDPNEYHSKEEEIELFCRKTLSHEYYDFFIFGHRHFPIDVNISSNCRYINTGDWIDHYSYAVLDGEHLSLNFAK